ncbi:MAG: 50S ribosomal protein L1 [Candidatus Omnitrophica bacterium]|nr:50S ribosomal protein L1 [Candidatus Omnitrophota bacterium]
MKHRSKRYKKALELFDRNVLHKLRDAVGLIKQFPRVKFDETVDLNFKLGIDPAQTEQNVRFSVSLPFGTGKNVKVLCFCKGEEARKAQTAGADYVGAEDLVQKISDGWFEFDVIVAHPDMMKNVSKLGRVLGPKGLMPSPKAGTVTTEIGKAVEEVKKGKVELKNDKTAGVHIGVGKVSFDDKAILENAHTVIKALIQHKPASSRGEFIRRAAISTSQGPGVRLDVATLLN